MEFQIKILYTWSLIPVGGNYNPPTETVVDALLTEIYMMRVSDVDYVCQVFLIQQ